MHATALSDRGIVRRRPLLSLSSRTGRFTFSRRNPATSAGVNPFPSKRTIVSSRDSQPRSVQHRLIQAGVLAPNPKPWRVAWNLLDAVRRVPGSRGEFLPGDPPIECPDGSDRLPPSLTPDETVARGGRSRRDRGLSAVEIARRFESEEGRRRPRARHFAPGVLLHRHPSPKRMFLKQAPLPELRVGCSSHPGGTI